MADRRNYWESYSPSLAAALVAVAAFAILTGIHAVKLVRTRTWFCLPLVIGGVFEIIGFASRAWGNKNEYILMPYLLQALFILLAPILFAATVYMILSRLIRATGAEKYSIVRVNWLTKLFVGGDFLCFLLQAAGGGILSSAKTSSTRKMGEGVILAGLIVQIVIFGFFLVVASVFHCRVNAHVGKSWDSKINFPQYMTMLYVVSALITLRNLFRVIEYAMGKESYLLANEWPLYVFDALLMVFVLVICSKWYVGKMEPQPDPNQIELVQEEIRGRKC